jgi:hypothetical protein
LASGFGVGLVWQNIFGNKTGGGTLAPFNFHGSGLFLKSKRT